MHGISAACLRQNLFQRQAVLDSARDFVHHFGHAAAAALCGGRAESRSKRQRRASELCQPAGDLLRLFRRLGRSYAKGCLRIGITRCLNQTTSEPSQDTGRDGKRTGEPSDQKETKRELYPKGVGRFVRKSRDHSKSSFLQGSTRGRPLLSPAIITEVSWPASFFSEKPEFAVSGLREGTFSPRRHGGHEENMALEAPNCTKTVVGGEVPW